MKLFGAFFILVGLVWGMVAYNMETTVNTADVGGAYSVYVPEKEVHNIGLMETRRNHLMFSGLSVVIGVLLFGFGSLSNSTGACNLKKCPLCAELIQPDAKKCRYCGGDIPEFWSKPEVPATPAASLINEAGQLVLFICPSCRATNNGSAKECSKCGAALPI